MSVFFLSQTLTKKMDSLARKFFWSGSMDKRAIHWVNSDTLCETKAAGGLGFKSFTEFNLAMLAKQGWRILENPEALWVRVLKSIYFPKCDFLEAAKGSRPSWIWASIYKAKEVVALGALKRVGGGESIDVNNDSWVPSLPGFLTPFNGCVARRVSDLIRDDPREWNGNLIRRFFSTEASKAILAIPLGPAGTKDEWIWSLTKGGGFSVRSAYHALRGGRRPTLTNTPQRVNDKIWKWLWNLSLPPKIRYFLWRCVKDVLATKTNLFRRKCAADKSCPLCHVKEESVLHCLFTCYHAREVWRSHDPLMVMPRRDMTFDQWLFPRYYFAGKDKARLMAAIAWNIWKARNEMVFNGIAPTTFATNLKVAVDIETWKRPYGADTTSIDKPDQRPTVCHHFVPSHSHSCPPRRIPDLVIHCDGSFLKDSQEAAYGVVMTNCHGQVCDGRIGTFFCSSAMVAEAKAILEAINLGSSRQVTTLVLSDNSTLVNILNCTTSPWPWECHNIIAQMVRTLMLCPWIEVAYTPRVHNTKADWVAKETRKNSIPENWVSVLNEDRWWSA
ncbi:Putative ribonuclease H protein At1g65750 [Linum perenne]